MLCNNFLSKIKFIFFYLKVYKELFLLIFKNNKGKKIFEMDIKFKRFNNYFLLKCIIQHKNTLKLFLRIFVFKKYYN